MMNRNKKNKISASELARQERARKFRQSRFYHSCLANSSNRVWLFNVASMHRIQKFGLDMFDENGQLLVRSHISLRRQQMSGDIFLTELIDYWLEQDAPYAYRFCAQINDLLRAYKEKYHSGHSDKDS